MSKANVEIMTPPHIVKEMCDQLPADCWGDPEYVFFEPSVGTGNFIIEILQRRLDAGLSIEAALNSIYAVDINLELLQETRDRVIQLIIQRITPILEQRIYQVEDSISYIQEKGRAIFEDYLPGQSAV